MREIARMAWRRSRWRWLDSAALMILVGYVALALSAHTGVQVAGQGLDPVWAGVQQRRTLRVAVDLGFYPFTWMEDGQPVGYDIDLARAIASHLGVQVEFVPSSLDSIYDDLAARRADIAISALPYAPEFGWRARFSQFYFDAGQMLVVWSGSPIASEADLAGRVVGVALGSDADTLARRRLAEGSSFTLRPDYDAPEDALAALQRGEIDAAIVDRPAALMAIARAPELRVVQALTFEPYVIAVAPEAYRLHEAVNQALDALRAKGFFEEAQRKWFR
ncbi:MAG: ABC transporter substrate-binding protein [Roseiflexus sp.]|nr:ABC transporter substrate-binding protein [Roseiflexus sp.]MCS7287928.1 ABC transporter substrate-binding protein [Roseiflexus sp.]MDW8147525.1 ABC transporter substrate-binding protein [Roseiflexaceae bacterium]MDW8233241.1 ABC transporter substrate-binding protein [Roseiflexaceae bacterium]